MKIYDLDDVLISPRIHQTWINLADEWARRLKERCPGLNPSEIPDEQFRVFPGGQGEIFITVRGINLRLRVPKNEYQIKSYGKA